MAVVRAGLGGQLTLERARAAMLAYVLRTLHFHTPKIGDVPAGATPPGDSARSKRFRPATPPCRGNFPNFPPGQGDSARRLRPAGATLPGDSARPG